MSLDEGLFRPPAQCEEQRALGRRPAVILGVGGTRDQGRFMSSGAESGARQNTGTGDLALAIDLGGTQYRVAAISADAEIHARVARPTRADAAPEVVIEDLVDAIGEIRARVQGRPILGVGVSAPGPLDPATGIVFQAPNLPRWRDVPLATALQAQLALPVLLGNDANLAGLAEARHGAGQGARDLVYLTVSTGIGSGILIGGRLVLGAHGAAGEAGHMALSLDGPLCGCGNRGCLEAYASGTGLANRATEALAAGRASSLSRIQEELTAVHISDAADEGDALAQELIDQAGHALGVGIRNLLHLFNPSVVVIGGGVSQIGPRLWDPVLKAVNHDAMTAYRQDLRIVPAALGDDSGLIGAALLVHEGVGPALRTATPAPVTHRREGQSTAPPTRKAS
jgi:glucokinase